jgi:hypothetical protein
MVDEYKKERSYKFAIKSLNDTLKNKWIFEVNYTSINLFKNCHLRWWLYDLQLSKLF